MSLRRGAAGAGFRPAHYREVTERRPVAFDFFEIVSENFMGVGGRPRRFLTELRSAYPVAMHGVALGIGGREPLDERYVDRLVALADWLEPAYVSDHLCWTRLGQHNSHDLLPLAYTTEALKRIASRLDHLQERLGRRFYLENPSAYVAFDGAAWAEDDFLVELVRRTGCGILLDVNNLYVNQRNLGLDPAAYLAKMQAADVCYMHVAGHTDAGDVLIDTHDHAPPPAVWDMLAAAAKLLPGTAAMIEWDDNVPSLEAMAADCERIRSVLAPAAEIEPRARPVRVEPGGTRYGVAAEARLDVDDEAAGQETFFTAVTTPESDFTGAMRLLRADAPVSAERGLHVYHGAYFARLLEVLEGEFPATAKLAGDGFAHVIATYLETEKPYHWSVDYAGDRLAAFLKDPLTQIPVELPLPLGVLGDAAAIERAQSRTVLAPDPSAESAPVTLADLGALMPEAWLAARVWLTPTASLVWASTPAWDLMQAALRDDALAEPTDRPTCYLVARDGAGWAGVIALTPTQAKAFEALREGETIEEAIEAVLESQDDVPAQTAIEEVAGAVAGWVAQGLVLALDTSARPGSLRDAARGDGAEGALMAAEADADAQTALPPRA
jgi:uncharacterized protein (UPF0276 family)